jgi:hypothetical protein
MNAENARYQHTQKHYASLYGRSVRTIAEYAKEGAPLDDPSAMQAYIKMKDARRKRLADLPHVEESEVADMSKGAAEALRRLEQAEAAAAVGVRKAEEGGDPEQIEASRKVWFRACRELRYFDKTVNMERRDGLELVPKAEAVEAVKNISSQVSSILYDVIDHVLPGNDPRRDLVRQLTLERFQVSLFRFSARWPKWAVEVIRNALGAEYMDAEELNRAYDLVFGLDAASDEESTKEDKTEADKHRRDAYNAVPFMDATAQAWRHFAYDENGKIKSGYVWAKGQSGSSHLVWRGPGECPEGLQPGETIVNGKVVMIDAIIK